ncbi:unnamed protein product [Oikopleura dioica]|uniref:Palmitoyl-protein thioesterase 1 n=1 Tax=Oikopleura dioica TaxID=34765 RepID=E4XM65_OIKDI|nr:unnamed protein product [Oikopleura dioica]
MTRIKNLIAANNGGQYVRSLMIGENGSEDASNGFRMPIWEQVEYACKIIKNDPELQDGYNAVGFSQGSQFLRGVAQTCPDPPMKNLVSIHGQHHGVFGFPGCDVDGFLPEICETLRDLLDLAYLPNIQANLVQAQYWHDSINFDLHLRNSQFIAPVNNYVREGIAKNETFKENLIKIEKFVMVKAEREKTVLPRDSSWFEYYADGSGKSEDIVPLRESDIYKEDWIGLKILDEANKLVFLTTPGGHMLFSDAWLLEDIIIPYLQ